MKFLVTVGHLGKDVGAVSPYDTGNEFLPNQERWVNLQQVNGMMAASLVRPEIDIVFAIPKGISENVAMGHRLYEVAESFSLGKRVALANQMDRWLIEVHNNSAPFEAKGAEVICYDEESAGYSLGLSIMAQFRHNGLRDRGVKTLAELGRDIYIIKKTNKPCIITEAGFMSHKASADKLDVDLDGFNEQIGALMFLGIMDYVKGVVT